MCVGLVALSAGLRALVGMAGRPGVEVEQEREVSAEKKYPVEERVADVLVEETELQRSDPRSRRRSD
jgi:hypothetical protein